MHRIARFHDIAVAWLLEIEDTEVWGHVDLCCGHPLFVGVLLVDCNFLLGLHPLCLCKASEHPLSRLGVGGGIKCLLAVDCHELQYGVLGDAVLWHHTRDCVHKIVCSAGVMVGIVRYLCLKNTVSQTLVCRVSEMYTW